MKKFMISAIAMMAFSVSSFAETNFVEKKELKNESISEFQENLIATSWGLDRCTILYVSTYNSAIAQGFNSTQAGRIATAAFNECALIENPGPGDRQE
ncbi:hypothetical protein [Flavobacterium sp.]|uniref:hypothetical protein n=1 Tax=Flavobacterium sp. TaxID=239 RepID=UPI0039E37E4C